MRVSRTGVLVFAILLISALDSSRARAPAAPDSVLRQHLVSYLEGGMQAAVISPGLPLSPLRSYPLTATTAYLLLEDDPTTLRKFYPDISRTVMRLFEEGNVAASGIIRAMPGSLSASSVSFSPGLNALAAIDLYSLHLIAWKAGVYEDALEYLSWANSLSEAVTRSFYDPSRRCFYPLDAAGKFVTTYGPGQLLPLVMDRALGPAMRGTVATDYRLRSVSQPRSRQTSTAVDEPWDNPLMRFTMLDLLSAALPVDGDLFQTLRSSAESSTAAGGARQAVWTEFWRDNRFVRNRLFPRWKAISSLVNLTLLFERESLVTPKELAGLKGGLDSLAAALSSETMTLDSYLTATMGVNHLLSRISRFTELLDSMKERWRILDEVKWLRLSPRIKRLIKEALANAPSELLNAKTVLAERLEQDSGIAFRIMMPERPIPVGKAVDFTASLHVFRDTLVASQVYVQIGENRWKTMEPGRFVTLAPGGAPFLYEGTTTLSPTLEPGIVTLPASIDFVHEGRRIEIHRVENIALTNEYDVTLDFPDGRRIRNKPVPVAIMLTYRPDRDVQGTVDGTFLREFTTVPALPARFVARKGSERTELTLTVASKGAISPGRYPFSMTMTLDGKPVALFEETLIRPFRWLHLGTLAKSDGALRNGLMYQSDLFKAYPGSEERSLRWKEVPAAAIDGEGILWPQYLYGKVPDRSALLYTVLDAPVRTRLVWKLATNNDASLWINSELVVSGGEGALNEAQGAIELRKGPNSFLIAILWGDAADRVSFELSDENGLPPTGLNNELDMIVDGYERLSAAETVKQKEVAPADQIRDIVVGYTNAGAVEVSIIGSFNNWEPGATPMRKAGKGAWTAVLYLRPGKYPYKFLVNRKQKVVDPANAAAEPDGFGGTNSILEVR